MAKSGQDARQSPARRLQPTPLDSAESREFRDLGLAGGKERVVETEAKQSTLARVVRIPCCGKHSYMAGERLHRSPAKLSRLPPPHPLRFVMIPPQAPP